MFNIKLEEKLYKMSFKALPVKMQRLKNRQGGYNVPFPWADRLNSPFKSSSILSCLKIAGVTPLHKKGNKDFKENCRPVSILPIFSKVFERSMFAQISSFFFIIICQNNNVDSEKVILHNNVF